MFESGHAGSPLYRRHDLLRRHKLTLSYRGTVSAANPSPTISTGPKPPPQGIPTIQEILGRAIEYTTRHPVRLVGSSRTDSGVHAKGQLAHFDSTLTRIPPNDFRRAINNALPDDIVVRKVEPVDDSFDVITCTLNKRYQYAIWTEADRPAFFSDLGWHRWKKLNVDAMRQAAERIVGEHDFASFSRPHHKREHTMRLVRACQISHAAAHCWSSASKATASCGTWSASSRERWWTSALVGMHRPISTRCSPPKTVAPPARPRRRTGYICSGFKPAPPDKPRRPHNPVKLANTGEILRLHRPGRALRICRRGVCIAHHSRP